MTATAIPTHTHPGREVVLVEATSIVPGDIVLARGCEHRETAPEGCEHRAYAAFDVEHVGLPGQTRVVLHTALADQEDRAVGPVAVLAVGDRVLVARRLPDLDPSDAVAVAAALPAEEPSCGPAGDLAAGGDLNRTWTCASARWAYARSGHRAQVLGEVERIAGTEAAAARTSDPRKIERCERTVRNLRGWVLGAIVRQQAQAARHPRPECTHAPADRRVLSVEDSLPACSC